jgi:hypothetical protein
MVRDMDGILCVWASDHEWIFFGIFCWRQWNVWKILFDTHDKIFGDVKKYFATCSWIKIYSKMKLWMTNENGWIFHECWQYKFFCEKLNNKIRWKTFMLVYFEIFDTWDVKVIFQIIFCIFSIWSILNSTTSKPYRMLN